MNEKKIVLSLSSVEADQLRTSLVDYSNILDERSEVLYCLAMRIENMMYYSLIDDDDDDASPETGALFPSSEG